MLNTVLAQRKPCFCPLRDRQAQCKLGSCQLIHLLDPLLNALSVLRRWPQALLDPVAHLLSSFWVHCVLVHLDIFVRWRLHNNASYENGV